jgi:hypothetical protein
VVNIYNLTARRPLELIYNYLVLDALALGHMPFFFETRLAAREQILSLELRPGYSIEYRVKGIMAWPF